MAASSGFYILILKGPLSNEAMHRYFASHPVSYCATVMFFVGLASLGLKLIDVVGQQISLRRITLDFSDDQELTLEEVPSLLERLHDLPEGLHQSYLARRLRDALTWVVRKSAAIGLDDELKYLADNDAARQQDSYSLVRIIIWATPMLGFLGTVIGITRALGDLGTQSELLATDPKTAMQGLLAGLYVAFDTTALALSLSILLMFIQFLVDRLETQLLVEVDRRTNDELTGRISEDVAETEPHLAAVRKMSDAVIQTAEGLVEQQTDHWKRVMDGGYDRWTSLLEASSGDVREGLKHALEQSIDRLAERLEHAEEKTDENLRSRWEQWQTALSDNARILHKQQSEMVRQGEVLHKVLEATAEIKRLEAALNDNLHTLAGAQHFEETVMSLSAAIQLLTARLGHTSGAAVQLDSEAPQGRAA
jgi:biopolymer transport protein ExbB/TolQ